MTPNIKLIAFDMDGTFLNTQNDYDRVRFASIWERLQQHGIRLVAISGNQYQQIKSFFPDIHKDMTIVSEVGAVIVENGQRLAHYHFDREVVEDLLALLAEKNLLERCSVSGLKALYFAKDAPEDFKKIITKHNYEWQEIESLQALPADEEFTLVTLDVPDADITALVAELNQVGKEKARAVSSGFHFIDIVQPGVNKGVALDFLAKRWGIEPCQMMAFGDSQNDLEMLEYAEHSYAMAGSPDIVCQAAAFQAPSNDESGVLAVIEAYLDSIFQ